MSEHIVDTHRDGIDADRVMLVHRKSELQFCADTVRSRNENRLFVRQFRQVKHAAKPPSPPIAPIRFVLSTCFFHSFYGFISGFNINPGVFIAFRQHNHSLFRACPFVIFKIKRAAALPLLPFIHFSRPGASIAPAGLFCQNDFFHVRKNSILINFGRIFSCKTGHALAAVFTFILSSDPGKESFNAQE